MHNLVDELARVGVFAAKDISNKIVNLLFISIFSAHKFKLPLNGLILNDKGNTPPSSLRLPYELTVIEYQTDNDDESEGEIVLASQEDDNKIILYILAKYRNEAKFMLFPIIVILFIEDGVLKFETGVLTGGDSAAKQMAANNGVAVEEITNRAFYTAITAVSDLLKILDCSNIEVETKELSPLKKQRNIKKPNSYFEYHLLKVKQQDKRIIYKNTIGTHASPREHLRRGHIHTFVTKEGRIKKWINSVVVNAGKGGKIIKDYLIA